MSIFGFIAGLISGNAEQQQMQDIEMMQQMQDMENMENMRRMSDPYENPGMDVVVDESFHGIDHGMGIANPEHIFEPTDDSFFGGSDDSFFGGFGGGDFF